MEEGAAGEGGEQKPWGPVLQTGMVPSESPGQQSQSRGGGLREQPGETQTNNIKMGRRQ